MADKVKLTPPTTDSKTPEWSREAAAGDLALDYVDWLGRDKVDPDAEHVLAVSISQALLSAYERGRREGIEEAAKVADRIGNQRSDLRYLSILHGKPAAVDVGYVGYTIRQLLEVKG